MTSINSLFCIQFQFNPVSALQKNSEWYNETPDRNGPADILVCVVSMNTVSTLKEEHLNKMRRIRTAARDYGENNGSSSMCNRVLLDHSLCCQLILTCLCSVCDKTFHR